MHRPRGLLYWSRPHFHSDPRTSSIARCVALLTPLQSPRDAPSPVPYSTLLHAVPFLTVMALVSTGCAYALLIALQFAVHPVLILISIFIPFLLVVSAIWAFSGSFIWDNREATWGETIGYAIELTLSAVGLNSFPVSAYTLSSLYFCIPVCPLYPQPTAFHAANFQSHRTVDQDRKGAHPTAYPIPCYSPCQHALLAPILIVNISVVSHWPFHSRWTRRSYLAPSYLCLVANSSRVDHMDMELVYRKGPDANDLFVRCRSLVFQEVALLISILTPHQRPNRKQYPDPSFTTKSALGRAAGPSLGTICLAALVLTGAQSLILTLRLIRRVC